MIGEVKVLIVDDHQMVREGFKLLLNSQDELELVVSELTDGDEVLQKFKEEFFDVVFMDVNMKKVGGVQATKKLLKKYKKTKVIALTMHNDEYNIQLMLDAGASGYLLKDTGVEEIKKAVVTVLGGQKYFSNEVALKLLNMQDEANLASKITKRELEVLKLIANGYTNEEVALKLEISKRTVDSHRQNLLSKFSCKNTAGLIAYALKNKVITL